MARQKHQAKRTVTACCLLLMMTTAEASSSVGNARPLPPPPREKQTIFPSDKHPSILQQAQHRPPPPRPPPQREASTKTAATPPQQEEIDRIREGKVDLSIKETVPPKRPDPPETGAFQKRPEPREPPRPPVDASATQRRGPPDGATPIKSMPPPHQRWQQQMQQQPQRRGPPPQQRWQQQTQQQRQVPPPRPVQHAQRLQPPPRQQQSTLKSLWQKVERGLDNLADLEDAVTDRAMSFLGGAKPQAPQLKALPPPQGMIAQTQDKATQTMTQGKSKEPQKGSTFGYSTTEHEDSSDDDEEKRKAAQAGSVDLYKLYAKGEEKPTPAKVNGGAFTQGDKDSERRTSPFARADGGTAPRRPVAATGGGTQPPHREATEALKQPLQQKTTSPFAYAQQQPQVKRQPLQEPRRPFANMNTAAPQRTKQESASKPVRPYKDDDDSTSAWSRIVSLIPPLPRLPFSKLLGRGSGSYKLYADASMDAWRADDDQSRKKGGWSRLFRRKGDSSIPSVVTTTRHGRGGKTSSMTPPIAELLSRSDNGNSTSLLSEADLRKSRSIGKSRAVWDVTCLGFVLFAMRQLIPYLAQVPRPHSIGDLATTTLPELRHALSRSIDDGSWAYFGFAAAILAKQTNALLHEPSIRAVAYSVGNMIHSATEYGQLYLRLAASLPIDKHVPDRLYRAASSQFVGAVSASRLDSFVMLVLSVVVLMKVPVIRPIMVAIIVATKDLVTLEQWRHWPIMWGQIGGGIKDVMLPLGERLRELILSEIGVIVQEPLKLAFICSIFLAMFTMKVLPMMEQRRPVQPLTDNDDDDEDDVGAFAFRSAETLSKLGGSSASRLDLFSNSGSLEGILERWRAALPESREENGRPPVQSVLRLVSYSLLLALLALFPLLLHHFLGLSSSLLAPGIIRSDSLLDSSVLLAFSLFLTWNSVRHLIHASDARPPAVNFLKSLGGIVREMASLQQSPQVQFASAISPVKGLVVNDLWTAHTAKRAWAVRGAHLSCRNGEVVVVLGDDGAGKSRLLTSISEAILSPPRQSISTTKVRGSITMGGLDVSKWDRAQLKRRLGLVLNDVRTVSDLAELCSGLTLEEILEPVDAFHNPSEPRTLGVDEKNAMNLALKITSLSTTLLPRLPSKLSTVVTANEDEITPSPLRPRCSPLSPSEWSKLLLARVLTQAIIDNENPASSSHSLEKSLIGSLLLLDDVMVNMSEVEEARLMATLRQTGAATVMTSAKWATGRFADRIVIVKDGGIVETGTHNELLARGPQQSIYAARWHAMTTL